MHHNLHVAPQFTVMLDWEDLHANQLRCAALHVCNKHRLCVPVWHSLHCNAGCAYLEGCTCVNFCVSSLQVTACSSSFLVHCIGVYATYVFYIGIYMIANSLFHEVFAEVKQQNKLSRMPCCHVGGGGCTSSSHACLV